MKKELPSTSPGTPASSPARKANLPTKICAACGRPFSWRRKWARCWEDVKWCSERCRRHRKRAKK